MLRILLRYARNLSVLSVLRPKSRCIAPVISLSIGLEVVPDRGVRGWPVAALQRGRFVFKVAVATGASVAGILNVAVKVYLSGTPCDGGIGITRKASRRGLRKR